MTTATIFAPSDREPGDFRRSKHDGRPYVWVPCICDKGKVPSEKVAGRMNKCPKCNGAGRREELWTRVTTFIDCLEDKTTLEKWRQRVVLIGLVTNADVMNRLDVTDPDDRDALQQVVDLAFESGDGYLKTRKGTDMHTLTEAWDRVEELPEHSEQEAVDLRAYVQLCADHDMRPVDIERRCVIDSLRVAGTPDRTWWWKGQLVIGDLKSGRVDLGAAKMAMQTALYSRGQWYDPETGKRTEMGVSQETGLIIHLPQGEATATLYTADLVEGWRGVGLAGTVRSWRNTGRRLLTEVDL